MPVYATPGQTIYPSVQWGATGSTLGVRIRRNTDGTDVVARSTAGIVESPSGSGIYVAQSGVVVPTTAGDIYDIVWDDGTATVSGWATEDLIVSGSPSAAGVPSAYDLCALADVKAQGGVTVTTDDAMIQDIITRASREIERWCQREFASRGTQTRSFELSGYLVDLSPRDLRGVPTTVTINADTSSPTTLTSSQYQALPIAGASGSVDGTLVYTELRISSAVSLASSSITYFGRSRIDVTGTWGFATVPDDVRHAAIITAAAWLDRSVGEYGMQQYADDPRNVAPQGVGLAIPLDAKRALDPYRRFNSL